MIQVLFLIKAYNKGSFRFRLYVRRLGNEKDINIEHYPMDNLI